MNGFKVGDTVTLRYRDSVCGNATIREVVGRGSFELIFEDGCVYVYTADDLIRTSFRPGDLVINKDTRDIDEVHRIPGMEEYDRCGFDCAEDGFTLKRHGWQGQDEWQRVNIKPLEREDDE